MGHCEPYQEPYGPPPAYSDVPADQVPRKYIRSGPSPSPSQPLQSTSSRNTGQYSSPYPGHQIYNAVPDQYQAAEALESTESKEDEQAVDELAAHYRQYLPPLTAAGFFSAAGPVPSAVLTRPILIPQAFTASFNKPPPPFVRVYSQVLSSREIDIQPALFLAIIDSLNLCLAPPPPLQAISLVGQAVGFVPSHIAQGVSAGIGIVAGVGVAAARITRQKRFLERVNQDVFAPRGLVLEVIKDEEVLRRVGVSLPPVPDAPPTPVSPGGAPRTHISRATQTRLAQLAPYSAPLSWDVPPPNLPTSLMDRISAKQTASRLAKEENCTLKKQQKKEDKLRRLETRGSSDSDSLAFLQDETVIHAEFDARRQAAEAKGDHKEVAKIEKKRAKEVEHLHKKQRKHQEKVDKGARKLDKQDQKQTDKERKAMGKLEWLVVRRA
ncbi:hypothetical protein SEUCBS139899_001969 [Sporothrix eucalyptigena]|uniref:Uncharacterized protein n=1 Tax=Sporothrix eucalyptigena TaxID=1812306 RepID=A0ABP0CLJ6_9PEZI